MTNDYYVGVSRGKEFRKTLLMTSKNVLHVLKSSSELEGIRNQKKFLTSVLRQEIQEILLLMSKLDELVPNQLLKESPIKPIPKPRKDTKQVVEKAKAEVKKPEPKEEEPLIRPEFELDRLERALAEVEKKLKYLG